MENTNRETQVGQQQIRTYKSENTNWKNTKREILIGKIQIRQIHIGKYKSGKYISEDTNRKYKSRNTICKNKALGKYTSEIQIKIQTRKYKSRTIQFGKYTSGNTNREIQVG